MVDSLYEHYVGHCPFFEVYLIHTTFCELALLLSPFYKERCKISLNDVGVESHCYCEYPELLAYVMHISVFLNLLMPRTPSSKLCHTF
jgi:hypothetical protein